MEITNRTSRTIGKEASSEIVKKIGKLWRWEEMYWGLRSQIN